MLVRLATPRGASFQDSTISTDRVANERLLEIVTGASAAIAGVGLRHRYQLLTGCTDGWLPSGSVRGGPRHADRDGRALTSAAGA